MSKELLEVAGGLHSTAVRLLRTVRHVDQESGLSPASLSALSVLVFAGPLTVGKLADAEGVRSPTMTGIVNGLVAKGLAERRTPAGDRRAVQVAVTGRGRRLFDQARQRRVEAVAALLEELSAEQVQSLAEAVTLLKRVLEK